MRIFEKKTDIMDYNSIEAQEEIMRIIQNALREDLGDGDHSSLSCIPTTATGKALSAAVM